MQTYPPDVEYIGEIREAATVARVHEYGLWSECVESDEARAMVQKLSDFWNYLLRPSMNSSSRSDAGADTPVQPEAAMEVSSTPKNVPYIQGDEPIETVEAYVLGRQHLAAAVANTIRDLDARNGAVVAIVGPWGSGKTSLIRLIQRALVFRHA